MPEGNRQGVEHNSATVPLPEYDHLNPWEAVHWLAFGHCRYCGVLSRRSFDHGTVKLPRESERQHSARVEKHRLLDSAEQKMLALLAAGQVSSEGRRPALGTDGKLLCVPTAQPTRIEAIVYRRADLSFGAGGELINGRCETIVRLFDGDDRLQGTADDRSIPLYFDVRIPMQELRRIFASGSCPDPPSKARFAGRPTSRHLLEAKMRERAGQKLLLSKLAAEVLELRQWLKDRHSDAEQPGQSAVQNSLRGLFKELQQALKLSTPI